MKLKKLILSIFTAGILFSCTDAWNEHYSLPAGIKSDESLYNYIKSQTDLSTFTSMLKIAGYDSILTKDQSYTVWAPVNSALADIDLKDTVYVTNIVKNHIARFTYPTSAIESKTIYMLNAKFIIFEKTGSDFFFGGQKLISADTGTRNGVLHKINGFVPYLRNLWEFIGRAPGLDSLRNYLYSQSTSIFDKVHSVEIGTNDKNQAIYDSVIIFSNPILDRIGQLQMEDSLYGAILPNNVAWTKMYNRIKSNYKTLLKDGGPPQQRLYTQQAIVENLVYRIKNKLEEPALYDSLVSTTGTRFNPSAYLFNGATKTQLSNGVAYITDSLKFKAADAWQKPVKIEAENSSYGRSYLYSYLFMRSGQGSKFNVSDKRYLVSEPSTVSKTTPNSVTFPIPNTLSGKYNVYCVMLPSSIVAATDLRKNKVKFAFSYVNADGTQVNDAVVTATNELSTKVGAIGAVFTTKSDSISKMFVTKIDLPYCNVITSKSSVSDIKVKLKVESASLITETVKFDRNMRIDYVIMEPVQE